jgi:ferredoxin
VLWYTLLHRAKIRNLTTSNRTLLKGDSMIYYFSGTGNSKWIAEELARRTNDDVQSIAALQKDGSVSVFANCGSRIGIVFPIYAWGAPLLVERFCKSLTLTEGVYAYAVCTCGDEAGLALKRLKKMFAYQSAWSIAMPNNYIIGYETDSPEMEAKKVQAAGEKLEGIASAILAKQSVYDVHEGAGAGVKTGFIRPMFNTFARSTKSFCAAENCNGCGLCASICPIGAIVMVNDKPVWVRKHCTQCLGCINRCPQRAIQYGAGTAKRGRYTFKSGQ